MKRDIILTVFCEGESFVIKTYPNEYRSLMMLIFDKIDVQEFGDCLGMGRCGTCLIEIIDMPLHLSGYDRNEETTIRKAGIANANMRLACQIRIDADINGLKVNVMK